MSSGKNGTTDLDKEFGIVKNAISSKSDEPDMIWEKDRKPISLCSLDAQSALSMKQFLEACSNRPFREISRGITLLWAMAPSGDLWVAVEEIAELNGVSIVGGYPIRRHFPVAVDAERKLGHPCLLDGLEARAAGELYLDQVGDKFGWHLNFESGRFHREPERRLNDDQIKNVAKQFANRIDVPIHLDINGDFA